MKRLIITLSALGLLFGMAQAQQNGPGGNFDMPPPDSMPPDYTPPLPPEGFDGEIPEEIVVLRDEIKTIRDALRVSREAVLEELGEDASRAEKVAALALWREENDASFVEMRTLTEEMRDLIHEYNPDGPWSEIPDEIILKREDLHMKRTALAESRREAILALGENPTDEEVRAAVEAWREDNAEAIAETQALAMELREWFRESRPHREPPVITPGMRHRKQEFRRLTHEVRENRRDLRQDLRNPDLTEEERLELIQVFREEQRELMRERKQLLRQQRLNQGGVGGDRRPGG